MTKAEQVLDTLNEYKDRREQQRVERPKTPADYAKIKANMAKLQRQMDSHYDALDKRKNQTRPDDEVLRATAKYDFNKPQGKYKGHQR